MILCHRCGKVEANPRLYLVGFGRTCYSCFMKDGERSVAKPARKNAIKKPETKLSTWEANNENV